jgi:hypothetical protein
VPSPSLKQTEKISGRNFPARALFSRCSPVSVVGRYAVLWRGVCRAFQNSSSDSCRSAWDVHSPLIGGYPRELRFTRLVSELYMPTAGTRSADRIDASRAGFRRSRQCSRVGRRQYGHRIGITKRTAGRYRTSQCSEELWYSVSGQARQAKLGDIPFSEGGFLGEHLESERQALSAPSRGQRGERGYPRQLWIRTKKYRPEISRDPSGSVNLFGPNLSRILDKKGIVARFPPCVTLRVICVGRSFVRPPLWAQRAPRKRHSDQFLDFRKRQNDFRQPLSSRRRSRSPSYILIEFSSGRDPVWLESIGKSQPHASSSAKIIFSLFV